MLAAKLSDHILVVQLLQYMYNKLLLLLLLLGDAHLKWYALKRCTLRASRSECTSDDCS